MVRCNVSVDEIHSSNVRIVHTHTYKTDNNCKYQELKGIFRFFASMHKKFEYKWERECLKLPYCVICRWSWTELNWNEPNALFNKISLLIKCAIIDLPWVRLRHTSNLMPLPTDVATIKSIKIANKFLDSIRNIFFGKIRFCSLHRRFLSVCLRNDA